MKKNSKDKDGKAHYTLFPGDFFAIKEECILETITGNSLVVCLYDSSRSIGGMGNFIVPGTIDDEIYTDEIARDGIQSMELLMAEIVKLGGDRRFLKAKLFGAGDVDYHGQDMESVEKSNIRFLHDYFSLENIEIEKEDLGGDFRRKIFFFPIEGVAFRRFQRRNEDSPEFKELESEYIDDAFKNKEQTGQVILF